MRALYFNDYGDPSTLITGDIDDVIAGPGEVRLRVVAAGLNPVDAKIRSGMLDGMFPIQFPVVTGWDVSGVVVSVGEGVSDSWIGRKVYAYARGDKIHNGTCAQFCCVPEAFIAIAPQRMDLVEAACVPLAALTAHQSLMAQGNAASGQAVLVLAGAGAVGRYAIQMAAGQNAVVTATARAQDHGALNVLGAAQCVDYRDEDWAAQCKAIAPAGFDFILDGVGGESLSKCYDMVAQGGCLVGLNDPPDQNRLTALKATATRLFSAPNGEQLSIITQLIDSGRLKPLAVDVMDLGDGVKAHAMLDKGAKRKIALKL